ncbi:MAG: SMC family ATPase [Anaerolineaceae bacterium]|nr:SMC family ATPase [Anaerolineaceae bacterium]
MNPVRLFLNGFLSYQNATELDFSSFELACISGSNGAGKSSLLDAITWVLFGEARSRDDDELINAQVNSAEVELDFEYEGNLYRVKRSKPRGKTSLLEFYLSNPEGGWRVLTEKSVRETENRLRQVLRMDFETFINASFFLQGRADQFAQQNPTSRKRILTSVLGLEVWETYKTNAAERRKNVEAEVKSIDAQLAEIEAELAQEGARKERLAEIEKRLGELGLQRKDKEAALAAMQRLATALAEQARMLELLRSRLDETRKRCERLQNQSTGLEEERGLLQERIERAGEIEAAYERWQTARQDLERWEKTAAQFHEVQARRSKPMAEIAAGQSRLEEERRTLTSQSTARQQEQTRLAALEVELPGVQTAIQALEEKLGERAALEEQWREAQQSIERMRADNERLKVDMKALRERLDRLGEVEGAACPLCGQPLSPDDRQTLIDSLTLEGKQMGDLYRQNVADQKSAEDRGRDLRADIERLSGQEKELRFLTQRQDQLAGEIERIQRSATEWAQSGALRLAEIDQLLGGEDFAQDARALLAQIDQEAKALGYDTAVHDATRRSEMEGRAAERELRDLEAARASLQPLERQMAQVGAELNKEREQLDGQEKEFAAAEARHEQDAQNLPDLDQAESEVLALQAEENRLRMDVGMVRQMVAVLDTQRKRKKRLSDERSEAVRQVARLKMLERAFGKDGVPALLIEQALPEIETQANDILDRLTMGGMSVRFATQRQLKSKDEKRETLDILISDSAGQREYEMFSGGEAFRINFAIRLALSRVLAHRAGARLQTLFIDEGFGSQDADGRQRLVEAINLVRGEFSRILVITHLEELKDHFPARIEVEKGLHGSQLRVVT